MRIRLSIVCAVLIALGWVVSPSVRAEEKTTDKTITVHESDLTPEQLTKIKAQEKIQEVGSWVGIGHEVGEAVNEGLKAVTVNTAEFGKTGVGKFTMFIIAWKVLGHDFLKFVVCMPTLAIWILIFIWSLQRNCFPRTILKEVRADKTKIYETIHTGSDKDEEKLIHVIVFGVGVIILLLTMFA